MNFNFASRIKYNPTRRVAFTLIELLVVIAIIALLAAILFPVFQRARENARRSGCQSNMKQMVLGITQYSQDFDERLIPCNGNNTSSEIYQAPRFEWDDILQPYLKSRQIFACPSAGTRLNLQISYSYNALVAGSAAFNASGSTGAGQPGRNVGTIPFPAETPLFAESGPSSGTDTDWQAPRLFAIPNRGATANFDGCTPYQDRWNCNDNNGRAHGERHFDGVNLAFVDGHVKWRKSEPLPATGAARPPRDGLDYDGDGTRGGPNVTTSIANGGEGTVAQGWD